MISCVIIDDEENNILNLQLLLKKHCPGVNVLATAMNADDGVEAVKEYKPDLVFLDIQMPHKNGFQMLQLLPRLDFEIVFVTAYDQYGIQAVKWSALDYLLKPVKAGDLQAAVNKAVEKMALKNQNEQLHHLIHLLKQGNKSEEQRIALPSAKEIRFIQTAHIIRCESANNYTTFHLLSHEKILVSKPIYEYEELLQEHGFIRCHQSHLVNKKFIKSWIKNDGDFLLMEDKSEVPVSRQKKEFVKRLLL